MLPYKYTIRKTNMPVEITLNHVEFGLGADAEDTGEFVTDDQRFTIDGELQRAIERRTFDQMQARSRYEAECAKILQLIRVVGSDAADHPIGFGRFVA